MAIRDILSAYDRERQQAQNNYLNQAARALFDVSPVVSNPNVGGGTANKAIAAALLGLVGGGLQSMGRRETNEQMERGPLVARARELHSQERDEQQQDWRTQQGIAQENAKYRFALGQSDRDRQFGLQQEQLGLQRQRLGQSQQANNLARAAQALALTQNAGKLNRERMKFGSDLAEKAIKNDVYRNLVEREQRYGALQEAYKHPSAVSDQEFVRTAIQALEPGLAVREGEAAAIEGAQGVSDMIRGAMRKAFNGESALEPSTRREIMRLVERQVTQNRDAWESVSPSYNARWQNYGGEGDFFEEFKVKPYRAPDFDPVVGSQQQFPSGVLLSDGKEDIIIID